MRKLAAIFQAVELINRFSNLALTVHLAMLGYVIMRRKWGLHLKAFLPNTCRLIKALAIAGQLLGHISSHYDNQVEGGNYFF